MDATFRLKRPRAIKKTSIYLDLWHEGMRTRFYTGESIHPDLWSQERQRAKPTRHFRILHQKNDPNIKSTLINLNNQLDTIRATVNDFMRNCRDNRQLVTAIGAKKYLQLMIRAKIDLNEHGEFFTDYFQNVYLPSLESGDTTYSTGHYEKVVKASTIKSKKSILRAFQEYEKSNPRIRLSSFDKNGFKDFVKWNNKKKRSLNYIGKQIKEMKVVFSHSYQAGLHSNKEFKTNWKVFKEDPPKVYLTKDELKKIAEIELNNTLSRYRDLFLAGCHTAMRWSDYSTISSDDIKKIGSKKYIDKITLKTGERVIIPISPQLDEILSLPNYFDRKPLQQQKLNDAIKVICKKAGINEMIPISRIVGGMTIITSRPKWELITTHSARRTGATLLYLEKIPVIDIMKITGHRTQESFLKYICVTKDETARRLAEHSHFAKKLTVAK